MFVSVCGWEAEGVWRGVTWCVFACEYMLSGDAFGSFVIGIFSWSWVYWREASLWLIITSFLNELNQAFRPY